MTPERRKVLLCIPSLQGGGAERVFSTLLQHLDRSCFEVHLAILHAAGQYMRDVPQDVTIHELGASRVRYAPLGILRLVWNLRPHAILSTLGHLNVAVIAAKPLMPRGTRVFIREATMPGRFLQEVPRHPRLWRWLFRRFYKRADRIVCLSDFTIDELVADFDVPREKLVRIYNPVDVEKIRRLAGSDGNPYSGPGPHLVTASRLSPEKGVDLLIDAMPAVLQRLPGARLTILGEGPLLTDLLEQSKRLGLTENVRFLGFQKNPWGYMRYADLFVLSSHFEGLSNAVLEALALGTRVVATDCPGALREIQNCCKGITLAPPGNPVALADEIIATSRQARPRSEYREAPPSLATAFNLHQVISEYSKLLLG